MAVSYGPIRKLPRSKRQELLAGSDTKSKDSEEQACANLQRRPNECSTWPCSRFSTQQTVLKPVGDIRGPTTRPVRQPMLRVTALSDRTSSSIVEVARVEKMQRGSYSGLKVKDYLSIGGSGKGEQSHGRYACEISGLGIEVVHLSSRCFHSRGSAHRPIVTTSLVQSPSWKTCVCLGRRLEGEIFLSSACNTYHVISIVQYTLVVSQIQVFIIISATSSSRGSQIRDPPRKERTTCVSVQSVKGYQGKVHDL